MSDPKPVRSKLRTALLAALGLLLVAAIGIQFVPVDRSNPPVTLVVDAPPEVMSILRRSCFDCHSNETVWPWYSKVAPMSWLVAKDVREGREHVNYSTWDLYDAKDRAEIIEEVAEETANGEMPLWFYVPLHPSAKLSDADLATLSAWAGVSGSAKPAGSARGDGDDDDDDH